VFRGHATGVRSNRETVAEPLLPSTLPSCRQTVSDKGPEIIELEREEAPENKEWETKEREELEEEDEKTEGEEEWEEILVHDEGEVEVVIARSAVATLPPVCGNELSAFRNQWSEELRAQQPLCRDASCSTQPPWQVHVPDQVLPVRRREAVQEVLLMPGLVGNGTPIGGERRAEAAQPLPSRPQGLRQQPQPQLQRMIRLVGSPVHGRKEIRFQQQLPSRVGLGDVCSGTESEEDYFCIECGSEVVAPDSVCTICKRKQQTSMSAADHTTTDAAVPVATFHPADTASNSEAAVSSGLLELPSEVLRRILCFVTFADIARCATTECFRFLRPSPYTHTYTYIHTHTHTHTHTYTHTPLSHDPAPACYAYVR